MARSSSTLLTRYVSATTIVTADIANMWFGGLYNTTEGELCDVDDPLVAGHVHDGVHQDGHAQKVNLVSHVTSQLRNTNLADDAVNVRNIQSFTDINSAVPISEMVDGIEHFFLDLSALSLATGADNLQEAWAGGNRIVVPDGSATPVLIINNDTTVSAVTLNLVSNTNNIGLLVDQNGAADAAEFNGDVTINGKLTVTGLIDPTGLVLDHQATRPATPVGAKAQYWARSDDAPMFTTSSGTDINLSTSTLATVSNVTSNSPGTLATDDFVFGSDSLDFVTEANRLFFDKSKGAVRGGIATGTEWDDVNRGTGSMAFGADNIVSANYSSVAGGQDNDVTSADGGYHFIGAGAENVISGGINNVIVGGGGSGGFGNTISASGASGNFIGGGNSNSMSAFATLYCGIMTGKGNALSGGGSWYSHIVGGLDNILDESNYASILGGDTNTITEGDYSTIIGGSNNVVLANSERSVVFGSYASTTTPGSFAQGGGPMIGTTAGSAQVEHFVCRSKVGGGSQTVLTLYPNGIAADRIYIPNNGQQQISIELSLQTKTGATVVSGGYASGYGFVHHDATDLSGLLTLYNQAGGITIALATDSANGWVFNITVASVDSIYCVASVKVVTMVTGNALAVTPLASPPIYAIS